MENAIVYQDNLPKKNHEKFNFETNFDKDKFSSACLGGRLYASDEDKIQINKDIKWTNPSIIKSYESN